LLCHAIGCSFSPNLCEEWNNFDDEDWDDLDNTNWHNFYNRRRNYFHDSYRHYFDNQFLSPDEAESVGQIWNS
jgi:hypothetical protein